jgi:hypothetical protein
MPKEGNWAAVDTAKANETGVENQLRSLRFASCTSGNRKQRLARQKIFVDDQLALSKQLVAQQNEIEKVSLSEEGIAVRKLRQSNEYLKMQGARNSLLVQANALEAQGEKAQADQLRKESEAYSASLRAFEQRTAQQATELRQETEIARIRKESHQDLRSYLALQEIKGALTDAEYERELRSKLNLVEQKTALQEMLDLQEKMADLKFSAEKKGDAQGAALFSEKELELSEAITDELDRMGASMLMMVNTGNSLADSFGNIANMIQLQAENQKAFAKERAKYAGNEKALAQLDKANQQQNIRYYSQLAGAISSTFEEGSKEARAFYVIQQSLAVAEGVSAILAQGKGDPYTAIPRTIAMTAMVGALLSNIGATISGSGGGSSVAPSASGQELGALGGGGSKDTLANTKELLETNKDQFRTLQGIYDASWKTANSIENLLATAFKTGDMARS